MAKALMVCATGGDGAGNNGITFTQNYPTPDLLRYFVLANASLFNAKTTEANAQITYRADGVLSTLYVRVTANTCTDGDTIVRTRKNAGNGAQSVTITAGTTGEYEDNTNTDTVTAANADEWNYLVDVAPAVEVDSIGSLSLSIIASCFAATTNTSLRYAAVGFPDISDGATYYFALADSGDAVNDTEAKSRFDTNGAASYRNLLAVVSSNLSTPNGTTVRLRQNGVDSSLALTITALTTGIFEDVFDTTGHQVSGVANDDITYAFESQNQLALIAEVISVEAISTDQTFHSIFARSVGFAYGANGSLYFPVGGGYLSNATEANVKADLNLAATVSNLGLYVAAVSII